MICKKLQQLWGTVAFKGMMWQRAEANAAASAIHNNYT
jgi:hypothetical protein